jgi:hypothetical protein
MVIEAKARQNFPASVFEIPLHGQLANTAVTSRSADSLLLY